MSLSLSVERFPSILQELVSFHDAVERIYCFLIKRKITCTVAKVETLYNELVANAQDERSRFDIDKLCYLCSYCPDLYGIRICNIGMETNNILPDLDFLYAPHCSSASASQVAKRRKGVIDALSNELVGYFMSDVCHADDKKIYSSKLKCAKAVNKDGWPTYFNLDSFKFRTLSEELLSMCVYFQTRSSIPHKAKEVTNVSMGTSCETESLHDTHNVGAVSIDDSGGATGILDYLKCQPFYKDQIKHVEHVPSRGARYAALSPPALPTILEERLHELGVVRLDRLYLHQARAIDALRSGKHAVISTSTASGKSMIYNIPVLEGAMLDPQMTALYLFPTKALAQDQLRSLVALTGDGAALPVSVAVCDGDTPQHERCRIQYAAKIGAPNIILTNPDMLHCTLLPEHRAWKRIFENIRFVVIDEAHLYRGAFGSHVAAVLRRLVRVCLFYGRSPQFLCCSATIANPAEHMKRLVPLDALYRHSHVVSATASSCEASEEATRGDSKYLEVVGADLDGAPQGERHFVVWNPPLQRTSGAELNHALNAFDPSLSSDSDRGSTAWRKRASETELSASSKKSGEDEEQREALDTSFSPKKKKFMQACADTRPATLGATRSLRVTDPFFNPRSAAISAPAIDGNTLDTVTSVELFHRASNPEYEVKYVGGWKRGRKPASRASGSPRAGDEEENEEEEDVSCGDNQAEDAISPEIGSAWNEPHLSKSETPPQIRRASSIWETASIFTALVKKHLRTLAFCKARKLVELVLNYSLRNLETSGSSHLMTTVASYRGGYTKEERRLIESDLFSGRLLGVTATNALELGIDVGALDATLHMGFPGTFSSLWQQAGRAGRSGRSSLSIIVCFESPIDQYFARHPEVLFHSPVEPAILDVNNLHVMHAHMLCAAAEVPLNYSFSSGQRQVCDIDLWGSKYGELLQYLVEARKVLSVHENGSHNGHTMQGTVGGGALTAEEKVNAMCTVQWRAGSSSSRSRASTISLRMIDPVTISIVDDSRGGITIDTLGYSRAFFELYEGAIYMHRAVQYRVLQLNLSACVAHTRPVKVKYYTSANNKAQVNVLKVEEHDGIMCCGQVQVVQSVYGYTKHWLGSGEPFEQGECSLPPLEYETCAFWIDLPLHVKRALEAEGLCPFSSMHAANHALLAVAPLYAQCDATDIATEHAINRSALLQPFRIMIYDVTTGGLGASTALYHTGYELLKQAKELAASCTCGYATGCPCCTLNARCSHHNQDLDRKGALLLLSMILDLWEEKRREQAQADASEVGGFLHGTSPHRVSYPVDNKSSSYSSIGTSSLAAQKLMQTGGASAQQQAAATSGTDPSPRKERRRKALKSSLNRDRAHQMAVQMKWTESVPTFYQDGDL